MNYKPSNPYKEHREHAAGLARDAATLLGNPWATRDDLAAAESKLQDAALSAYWATRMHGKVPPLTGGSATIRKTEPR